MTDVARFLREPPKREMPPLSDEQQIYDLALALHLAEVERDKLRQQRDELLFAAKQALMAFEERYDAPKIREDLRAAIARAEGKDDR